jgi:hypothetical protein
MYYVKAATRSPGSKAKGSPQQALDYISDALDLRRDPGYSDAEGGRVPLIRCSVLAAESDQQMLAEMFERSSHGPTTCARRPATRASPSRFPRK